MIKTKDQQRPQERGLALQHTKTKSAIVSNKRPSKKNASLRDTAARLCQNPSSHGGINALHNLFVATSPWRAAPDPTWYSPTVGMAKMHVMHVKEGLHVYHMSDYIVTRRCA
jgi:hypothetical protein